MSENKCPFCGDAMITTEDKIVVCENADCATMFNEWDYPKVCAAMELAKALNEMDKLDAEMWKVGSVSEAEGLRDKRLAAHRRISNAMDKRAEVFK